jgi:uncharacterized membrane protein HdeD (DUF308 family)
MSNNLTDAQRPVDELRKTIAEKRGWFTALGILMVVLGVGAILFPLLTTIAVKIFLGWLFIVGGIGQIIHSFSCQRWRGFFYNLLIGILYVVVGAWLAFFPLTGIIGLTVLLAFAFLIEGGLEVSMGVQHRPEQGWVWIVGSGVISAVAGVLLLLGLPGTAAWAIGLLVGINLISSGWSFISLAAAARGAD